jgi:hypothetical protein
MPSYVIRVDRDEPAMYVMWSTIVDDITAYGTREELRQIRTHRGYEETADERFDRADETGTSDMFEVESAREGAWGDSGFVCQQKWLPRSQLRAYAENLRAGGRGEGILQDLED